MRQYYRQDYKYDKRPSEAVLCRETLIDGPVRPHPAPADIARELAYTRQQYIDGRQPQGDQLFEFLADFVRRHKPTGGYLPTTNLSWEAGHAGLAHTRCQIAVVAMRLADRGIVHLQHYYQPDNGYVGSDIWLNHLNLSAYRAPAGRMGTLKERIAAHRRYHLTT